MSGLGCDRTHGRSGSAQIETIRTQSKTAKVSPQMAGAVMKAILEDTPYPMTLINAVERRINAEHDISPDKAAIIKAYYLRATTNAQFKEVLRMDINEESGYLPYVLGRMFSIYEQIVEGALFYQRTRRRERVELTEELRGTVVAMVQEMHQLFSRGHTPRVKPRKACSACSLKDICLPELLKAKSAEQYIHAYVNEETS